MILSLQRTAGNSAVALLLEPAKHGPPTRMDRPAALTVARQSSGEGPGTSRKPTLRMRVQEGPSLPGTMPRFILDVSPQEILTRILGGLDLHAKPKEGTRESVQGQPEHQNRVRLIDPVLKLDLPARHLRGSAILSFGSEYPEIFTEPLDLHLSIDSSDLPSFQGRVSLAGIEPIWGELTVNIRYKTPKELKAKAKALVGKPTPAELWKRLEPLLEQAVPGLQPGRLAGELTSLLDGLLGGTLSPSDFVKKAAGAVRKLQPRFPGETAERAIWLFLAQVAPVIEATGRIKVDLPGNLPVVTISKGKAGMRVGPEGPSLSYQAWGAILAPAGAISDVTVPALGYLRGTKTARSSSRFMVGGLQSLSPEAIGAGKSLVQGFPTFAYVEYTRIRHLSDGLEIGVKLSAQLSSPQVATWLKGGGGEPPFSPEEILTGAEGEKGLRTKGRIPSSPVAPMSQLAPISGVAVFGNFNWLGGK